MFNAFKQSFTQIRHTNFKNVTWVVDLILYCHASSRTRAQLCLQHMLCIIRLMQKHNMHITLKLTAPTAAFALSNKHLLLLQLLHMLCAAFIPPPTSCHKKTNTI